MPLYIMPAAGNQPVLQMIEHARRSVDLNVYELTDRAIEAALLAAGNRGVDVRIILEPRPFRASQIADTTLAWCAAAAPAVKCEDQQGFGYDHAKYMVVDDSQAEVGSANYTHDAFTANREYIYTTRNPPTVQALEVVFNADWQGSTDWSQARGQLVLSPGALSAMQALLARPGPIEIEAEEYGGVRELSSELQAKGTAVRMILPSTTSPHDRSALAALTDHGVQVRYLSTPYMHAKLIVTQGMAFVGSQNLSWKSLKDNREVGVVLTSDADLNQLSTQFEQDWDNALPR